VLIAIVIDAFGTVKDTDASEEAFGQAGWYLLMKLKKFQLGWHILENENYIL
jgi:hypothetical protein